MSMSLLAGRFSLWSRRLRSALRSLLRKCRKSSQKHIEPTRFLHRSGTSTINSAVYCSLIFFDENQIIHNDPIPGTDPWFLMRVTPQISTYFIAFDGDRNYYKLARDFLYKTMPGIDGIMGGLGEITPYLSIDQEEFPKFPRLVEKDRQLILKAIRKVTDNV